jgi:tocopherol O-methyltransferase
MATKLAQSKELNSSFALMDAEKMNFSNEFDYVWIIEAMSHMPNKELFFSNAYCALLLDGCLVIADWFKAEDLSEEQLYSGIKPIENGMLLPPLCSMNDYVNFGKKAGFKVKVSPLDISTNVSKTWDINWELVRNPSLWKFAMTKGEDAINFLKAFQAMRNGYSTGIFRYGVMVFQK